MCPYGYTICTGYYNKTGGKGCCDWDPSCPCYIFEKPSKLTAKGFKNEQNWDASVDKCGEANGPPTLGCSLPWKTDTNFFPEYGQCGYYLSNFPINKAGASGLSIDKPDRWERHFGERPCRLSIQQSSTLTPSPPPFPTNRHALRHCLTDRQRKIRGFTRSLYYAAAY